MPMGRIVDIFTNNNTTAVLTQGIPQSKQYLYNTNPNYYGSNGSYVSDFQSEYSLIVKISIYDAQNKAFPFDVRDYVLQQNGMKRVSSQLINYLKEKNVGKKVEVTLCNGEWVFNPTQLDVNYK